MAARESYSVTIRPAQRKSPTAAGKVPLSPTLIISNLHSALPSEQCSEQDHSTTPLAGHFVDRAATHVNETESTPPAREPPEANILGHGQVSAVQPARCGKAFSGKHLYRCPADSSPFHCFRPCFEPVRASVQLPGMCAHVRGGGKMIIWNQGNTAT